MTVEVSSPSMMIQRSRRPLIVCGIVGMMALSIYGMVLGFHRIALYQSRQDFVNEIRGRAVELERWIFQSQMFGMTRALGSVSWHVTQTIEGQLQPDNAAVIEELLRIRDMVSASVVYVMDPKGTVVACTPYGETQATLTGKNYAFRPYFQDAIRGKSVVYPAVGVTTHQRGLYYSAPAYHTCNPAADNCQGDRFGRIIGVVVIKMGLEWIDTSLEKYQDPVLLVSPRGIVFAGNRPEWIDHSAFPVETSVLAHAPRKPWYDRLSDSGKSFALEVDLSKPTVVYQGRPFAVETADLSLQDESGRWKLICLANQNAWIPVSRTIVTIISLIAIYAAVAFILIVRYRHSQAKLAVRESERKLRTLMNNLPGVAYRCRNDRDWTMQFLSDGCTRLTGYKSSELIGNVTLSYNDLIHPEDRQMVWDSIQKAIEERRHYQMEYRIRTKQGNALWVWEQGIGVYRGVHVHALEGLIIDITGRKLAEQAQHLGKEKLDQIIMGSPVPAFVIDQNHIITYWNKACGNLTGIQADQVIGTNHQWSPFYSQPRPIMADMIVDGRSVDEFIRMYGPKFRPSAVTEGAYEGEDFFPNLGPEGKWLFFTAAPIRDQDGRILGAIETLQDISDRKRAEQSLRLARDEACRARAEIEQVNRKLELAVEKANLMAREAISASRTKSEFLANMSHEIRTPMNAILGFGELLTEEPLTSQQLDYAKTICISGNHLLEIINDILDFSKIEAGKLTTEIIECSLKGILDEVDSLMRPAAQTKGLEYRRVQSVDLPDGIRTDPARLRQCLINLIGNAIKFTESGYVERRVSLTRSERPFLRFEVEDTGIGIPTDKQQIIFEPFSQADGSTTRRFGGTGLGLAITRQLVGLMGGRLSLRSVPGQGSTLTMEIPLNSVKSSPNASDLPSQPSSSAEIQRIFSGGRVLVAEDNPANQMLIETMLTRMGLAVTLTEDGKQALQKALTESFDAILMDIQMPVMNGYEATIAMRHHGIKTPIIALTAYAMKGDDKKCLSAGCDGYLTKPVKRETLVEVLGPFLKSDNETSVHESLSRFQNQVDELNRLCDEECGLHRENGESGDRNHPANVDRDEKPDLDSTHT